MIGGECRGRGNLFPRATAIRMQIKSHSYKFAGDDVIGLLSDITDCVLNQLVCNWDWHPIIHIFGVTWPGEEKLTKPFLFAHLLGDVSSHHLLLMPSCLCCCCRRYSCKALLMMTTTNCWLVHKHITEQTQRNNNKNSDGEKVTKIHCKKSQRRKDQLFWTSFIHFRKVCL